MKNQAKLKALEVVGAEVKYYYLRFGEGAENAPNGYLGTATICLLKNGGLVHRGIAFCSPPDQFVKKVGRNIALGRAIKAMEKRVSSEPVPTSTRAWILLYQCPAFGFLSTFSAGLTEYEEKLMGQSSLVTVVNSEFNRPHLG